MTNNMQCSIWLRAGFKITLVLNILHSDFYLEETIKNKSTCLVPLMDECLVFEDVKLKRT